MSYKPRGMETLGISESDRNLRLLAMGDAEPVQAISYNQTRIPMADLDINPAANALT